MSTALIFGSNGQDGFYLEQLLNQKGIEVTKVSRSAGNWIKGDVADRDFVGSLIKDLRPGYIFHLAAHSKTDHELLAEHQATIVHGTLNILESALQHTPSTKVFITGSGLQFENTGAPIHEDATFRAGDVYSLARIQSVYAARYYRTKGVKTYVGYLFHHDSPYRRSQHLNRRIADAARAAAENKHFPLSIGDITVQKEFGFAGDIVQGIFHLVEQDVFFEACIGTGKAYSIEKWLELCFERVGKNWKDFVTLKDDYRAGFKKMVSDPSLLFSSGWQPRMEIEELAALMLKSPVQQ